MLRDANGRFVHDRRHGCRGAVDVVQQGATFRARFNVPGEFDVACRIHPNMRGKVVVEP